jgi:TetR/AcrR family transcriptional regulator, repressor for uid operon
MEKTARSEMPSTSEVAQKRHSSREAKMQQILDATVRCIRLKGFHAASMADIAREAKISVGVIYLYFNNKEALLEAIAERDLAEMRAMFAEFAGLAPEDLLDTIIDKLDFPLSRQFDRSRSALALEMVAEAARNPKVEAIMQGIDAQGRELSRRFLSDLTPDSEDVASLDARGEIIMALIDGMMIRGVLNPESNRKDVHDTFRKVFRFVLTGRVTPEE